MAGMGRRRGETRPSELESDSIATPVPVPLEPSATAPGAADGGGLRGATERKPDLQTLLPGGPKCDDFVIDREANFGRAIDL